MHTQSYILLCLFWMSSLPLIVYSQDSRCASYSDHPRNCVNILQCPNLWIMVEQFDNNSVGYYLRSRVCGWEGDSPLVCCLQQPITPSSRIMLNETEGTSNLPPQLVYPACGQKEASPRPDDDSSRPGSLPVEGIVGGQNARSFWPWMAHLGSNTSSSGEIEWICGGSLISSRHVLTAAHCATHPNLQLVRLREFDRYNARKNQTPVDIQIERVNIHPQYSNATRSNDIAVLKLERNVEFSDFIKPICLPIPNTIRMRHLTGEMMQFAGWGATMFHGITVSHLQEASIPVADKEQCKTAFKRVRNVRIDHRVICAGNATSGGPNACHGDSGGPLMLNSDGEYYVVGVDSFGVDCARRDYFEVFVKVSEYLEFILLHMN